MLGFNEDRPPHMDFQDPYSINYDPQREENRLGNEDTDWRQFMSKKWFYVGFVKLITDDGRTLWRSIKRSDGYVYRYENRTECERMLKMTYPNLSYGTQVKIDFFTKEEIENGVDQS